MRSVKIAIVTVLVALASPALAGRGSSPGAIQSAIASGGVDAIQSELERAEHLVCPSCVRMVRPLLDHPDQRAGGPVRHGKPAAGHVEPVGRHPLLPGARRLDVGLDTGDHGGAHDSGEGRSPQVGWRRRDRCSLGQVGQAVGQGHTHLHATSPREGGVSRR